MDLVDRSGLNKIKRNAANDKYCWCAALFGDSSFYCQI